MRKIILFALLPMVIITISYNLWAQGTAGENYQFESRYIIEMPTAGMLPKNSHSFYLAIYPEGIILAQYNISFLTNFSLGISYSGNNIIGTGDVGFQKLPGFHLKLRIFNEQTNFPAFAIGINTQGRGKYDKNKKRFQTYSPGIYTALSKNYKWALGFASLHFGLGYSLDPPTNERTVNFWCGLEQTIFSFTSFYLEYNSTAEEKNKDFITKNGLLNAGLKFSVANGITLELFVKDLFSHLKDANGFSRGVAIDLIKKF